MEPTSPVRFLARALAAGLAIHDGTAASAIVIRTNANSVRRLTWTTIAVDVPGHSVVLVATADPFVPNETVWTVEVDLWHIQPYEMTYARPLTAILAAAWHGIRVVTAPDAPRRQG